MPRCRRDRRRSNGQVYFITARVIKGLPFAPRASILYIIKGLLARAQQLYPIKICAIVVMGNHIHLILTGHAIQVSRFMNYLQGEVAKSIKKLIPGYYEGVVWSGRFKEQILATPADVISKMSYIYLNPVKAQLVNLASAYPGISSFRELKSGRVTLACKWTSSKYLKALPELYKSSSDYKYIKENIIEHGKYCELEIDPFAWISSFPQQLNKKAILQELCELVKQGEENFRVRKLNPKRLRYQRLRQEHTPKTKSPTPFIICSDKELRIALIQSYRDFCNICREAWRDLRKGIRSCWPKGAFRPSMSWAPI